MGNIYGIFRNSMWSARCSENIVIPNLHQFLSVCDALLWTYMDIFIGEHFGDLTGNYDGITSGDFGDLMGTNGESGQ